MGPWGCVIAASLLPWPLPAILHHFTAALSWAPLLHQCVPTAEMFKPQAHSKGDSQHGLKPLKQRKYKPLLPSEFFFSIRCFTRDRNLALFEGIGFHHRSSSLQRERGRGKEVERGRKEGEGRRQRQKQKQRKGEGG